MSAMDRFGAHLDRAWELIAKGDARGAWVSASLADQIDSESAEVQNLYGYIAALEGDFSTALDHYLTSFEIEDGYLDPLLNAAEILAGPAGEPLRALELCEDAREIAYTDDETVEVTLVQVEALLNLERRDDAAQQLFALGAPDSINPAYLPLIGRGFYEVGALEQAAAYIGSALNKDPDNADAWYYHGLVRQQNGDRLGALQAFLATRSLDLRSNAPADSGDAQLDGLVARSIDRLEGSRREQLKDAQIIVRSYPSRHQILREADPRQIVMAQGLNAKNQTIRKLWIFTYNLERSGIAPEQAELALTDLICEELGAWDTIRKPGETSV